MPTKITRQQRAPNQVKGSWRKITPAKTETAVVRLEKTVYRATVM